ncbi:SIS domain-containing protein [Proteiniclasticum sp. SCR006]|uniref:SIS domain-containing protein n=1 Tax=Proteiniclasticum aestuarii TaxID=2817862 RepID=A0A939HCE9_9CLOT|nr:SIS domain-containing protein [Proteiniclasticum aestuarii]MBO1265402.1 SIS domain-containing protein [Proteiniclasticum aestuarii]
MGTLLNCIEMIPEKLEKIVKHHEHLFEQLESYIDKKEISRISVVASGTSYNAAMTSKRFGEHTLNLPIEVIYPNTFMHYYNEHFMQEDVLYVFISQTGTTKLVHEAVKRARDRGLMNIAITENDQSPIAQAASLSINMGTDMEEYVYRTIGYSATYTTMILIYLYLKSLEGDSINSHISDLENAVDHITGIVDETHLWYDAHAGAIAQFDKFIFAGASDLLPVAMEADIKFMEMVPVFTNTFEMEELIHGPQNAFDQSIGYFLLSKKAIDADKASNIAEFILKEIGPNAMMVGDAEQGGMNMNLSFRSRNFYPLEIITVFQVLAYRIAVDRGRDLKQRINGSVTKYIQKSL